MKQKNSNGTDANDVQEKQNQEALGNTDVSSSSEANADLKRTPKITGTGSNPPAAAPESLIVHEDEDGNNRYENHKPGNQENIQ